MSSTNSIAVVGALPSIFNNTKPSAIAGVPSYLAVPLNTVSSSINLTCSDAASVIPALSAKTYRSILI